MIHLFKKPDTGRSQTREEWHAAQPPSIHRAWRSKYLRHIGAKEWRKRVTADVAFSNEPLDASKTVTVYPACGKSPLVLKPL